MNDPLTDLIDSLAAKSGPAAPSVEAAASTDPNRETRKGIPEVVLAEGKRHEHVLEIAHRLLMHSRRAIISRVAPDLLGRLREEFVDHEIEVHETSRIVVVRSPGHTLVKTGGKVGTITAGTSDVRVAEEAAVIATEMGCQTLSVYDVGVAGLVDVPVIGVPTSVGYGMGGKGLAALLSMLQTCSPGLVVVNIDNGIGAGATAALMANRAARARARTVGT